MATRSFNTVPTIHAPRSRFDMSFSHKTSGNVGTLYPCYIQEIYPGDVFDCTASIVTRLSSAYIRPVMDDLYLDMYFFFVPSRLVYDKWPEIFGENRDSAWAQASPKAAPVWSFDSSLDGDIVPGSVADHFGLPLTDILNSKYLPNGINILPFRAFALIYDEWFRDENIIAPMDIQKGSFTHVVEYFNSSAWSSANYFGMCPKVAKFHDYFTSCLPGTQKGDAVTLPIRGNAPLTAKGTDYNIPTVTNGHMNLRPSSITTGTRVIYGTEGTIAGGDFGAMQYVVNGGTTGYNNDSWITNLYADLTAAGVQATVNDLRYAFQLQKILERSARSGSRYTEYLLSAFSVKSPDARLQRPEYLGGKRMPLSVQQVAQTARDDSAGVETLASLGAFSLSNGKCGYSKGFVEHGFVIGCMCVRQRHTYQQGIEKFWSRSERFSYYDPTFANIGEQPVYKDELYALQSYNNIPIRSTPFGYQEAWADLRYRPNMITGQMRSDAANSLDIWHFGDDYANAPTLNKQWLEETPDYVDRTIAVPSGSLDQFIFDIYFKNIGTRRLPTWSIPSLIDHN